MLHVPTKPISPTSFSAFSQKSKGILYIWAGYISNLLVIARYFASFTSNQGLMMKFASYFFSFVFLFVFPFFSLFDVWVFASDLIYWNPWWWVFNPWWTCLLLCFFFLSFFFFFYLFDVWVFASDLFHFGARGDEVYIFYIWVFRPMLILKIKQPRYQTEQYSQASYVY